MEYIHIGNSAHGTVVCCVLNIRGSGQHTTMENSKVAETKCQNVRQAVIPSGHFNNNNKKKAFIYTLNIQYMSVTSNKNK